MTVTKPSGSAKMPAPLAGEWRVEDIAGRPILAEAPATLRFEADGRFSGRTGCNHITGSVRVEGKRLAFSEVATTRMICPPAMMDQEQRLVQALGAVRAFHTDEQGCLHLAGEYEPFLLRASRRR